jgi:hypothetical protein
MTLQVIFSAASLILCGFFFIYFRSYLRRRISREEIFSDYRDEVEKLVADIDAATERDLTLIEDRLKTLRETLDTADRRIAVLARELDRKKASETLYTSLGKRAGSRQEPSGHTPEIAGTEPAPEEAETVPVVKAEMAPVVQASEAVEAVPAEAASAKSMGEKAAELAEAGFSPERIAARLGISVSEVDLAITIHRR